MVSEASTTDLVLCRGSDCVDLCSAAFVLSETAIHLCWTKPLTFTSNHAHTPPVSFDHISSRNIFHGSGAELTRGYWSMVSLYNINPESVYDGQQRSFEDFQFDLENVLTSSQLCGKSAEECIAAAVMLEVLAGMNKTAAEVAAEVVTDATRNRQRVLYAVLAANTARRARVILREDNTKNGAWAWARLRERFGRVTGATSFTKLFQYSWPSEKPFEEVWREWVNKVSKLPQGSLISQAIGQLTISRMARHGQPELENHLRLRAPMAWQDIQTQVEKYLSTIYNQQSPQPMDIGTATTNPKCKICGSQTHKRSECWYKNET